MAYLKLTNTDYYFDLSNYGDVQVKGQIVEALSLDVRVCEALTDSRSFVASIKLNTKDGRGIKFTPNRVSERPDVVVECLAEIGF